MAHVAKWWLVGLFDNSFRRFLHDPQEVFGPYVKQGMTALDVGCGAGYNAVALAQLVGENGRVIAADIQPPLLRMVERRARRAGVADRVETLLCQPDDLGYSGPVDFVNAFWMVHETPDPARFFQQAAAALKPGGVMLVAEPRGHVSQARFDEFAEFARRAGLEIMERPRVRFSRAMALRRGGAESSHSSSASRSDRI